MKMSHKKSKCVVEPSLKENHKCTESYLLLWCWKEMQKREFNNGIDIGTRIQPTSCWKTQGKMIKKNNFEYKIRKSIFKIIQKVRKRYLGARSRKSYSIDLMYWHKKLNWTMLKTRLSRFNETSILDNKNNTFYHVVKQRFHYFDILGEDFDDETSSLADNFRPGRDIFYSSKGWSILYGPYNLGFILENNFASSRELQNRSWRQPVWSTKSFRWIRNKLCLHEKCF